MPTPPHPPAPTDLPARLHAAVAQRPGRIQRVEVDGVAYWVKQREELGLRLRLQKGNPARAFYAERGALHALAGRGLPVPPIVAEGAGFFATADHGPTLAHLIRHDSLTEAERIAAFTAAGRGLAAFHAQGVSHGRPSVRDICWDGSVATFIDLERYHPRRNHLSGHAQDLIMFVLSAYTAAGGERAEIDAACDAYRAAAPDAVWTMAQRWCRRLRWVDPLTRPLQRGSRLRAEFAAIPLTLRRFGVLAPAQA
jgi:tRNA A-37 threonylcarbamoyl transferase component Bud32